MLAGIEQCGWVWQVRLVEEELSYCSYGEAYEVNCARYGRESDLPIAHFKKRCCSPNGNLISDPDGNIRLQVNTLQHLFAVAIKFHQPGYDSGIVMLASPVLLACTSGAHSKSLLHSQL